MNIGLFTDTYYPEINGVATSVLMLKENLEIQGHRVYVFTTTNPEALDDEGHVYRVPSIPFHVRRLGVFINPNLKNIIKGLELDIVHTHTEFSLGIFGRSVARSLHIPFVHTMHTLYEDYTNYIIKSGRLEPTAKAVARKMTVSFCNSADKVIVPTGKVKDYLLAYGVERSMTIIPTGIRLDKFSDRCCDPVKIKAVRAELNIAEKDKVLINIGRLSREKNLDEILRTMRSYLPERPDVKLLLIGDGPAHNDLKNMAAELGIHKQVIFAGAKPWDEIGLYYTLGDVFVSASQSETQGLTYIEALAFGLPVVAKEDRCLDGVLIEGENGYAFQNQDEFLAALDKVLYNDLEMERLSHGAVKTADRFSAANYADTAASLYQTMLINQGSYMQAS